MLLNYITIAFRNFRRQKSYTLLNVIGLSLGMAASIPGKENYWTRGVKRLSGGPEGNLLVTHVALDHEHVPQYEIRVVAGRNFDKRFPADDKKVLINESLSAALHFKEPALAIGEQVRTGR